jgi:tetratricopeptide (TPR) repeat protein
MQIVKQLQKQANDRKKVLWDQLPVDDLLITLFDLAVYFEEQYGDIGPSNKLQVSGIWLSKLITDMVSKRQNISVAYTEEEAQRKILERLVVLDKNGFDKRLIELCQTYENAEYLGDLEQIQNDDENCELKEYSEGCFRTLIKAGRFEHFQRYIKDGKKIEAVTEYYTNAGREAAFEMTRNGNFVPQGANEDDLADSFDILAMQIAAKSCGEHYGIEENFKLEGKEYNTSLLIQIISLLNVYAKSRYGYSYEAQSKKPSACKRILRIWQTQIEKDGRMASGPLFVDTWDNLKHRILAVFDNASEDEIERHLTLISTQLADRTYDVNVFEKPLLRFDNMVFFFARPLVCQNSWLPVIIPLLKNITPKREPEGKRLRVTRSTENLAERFRSNDFRILVDENLPRPENPTQNLTDVDILALKDDWLVILQIKMTHPRADLHEAASHKKQLKKAGDQMVKTMSYLEENWQEFRKKFDSTKEWSALKTIPLVVSTSFEFDREQFAGYLKISQFELERYLEKENLTGYLLQELIQSDALWRDLDPIVAANPIDSLLPEGCLSGSSANKAEEHFEEGNMRYGRQDYTGAETMYREAIQLFPHHEKYYKGLGNALVMQGRRNESLQYFDKAIQLNPYYGEGYNARGLTYAEMEAHDKAYADFQQAIRFSPDDISAWSHIAQLQLGRAQKFS